MAISFGFMEISLIALLFIFGMFLIFGKIIAGIFGGFRRNSRIKQIQENTDQLHKEMSELHREITDLREQIADLTIKLDNLNL